jgi:hypothetical protein
MILQGYLTMTPHRMMSRRVPAWWLVLSLSEVCGHALCRPGLHTLVQPAWYTRLSRGSNIRAHLPQTPRPVARPFPAQPR